MSSCDYIEWHQLLNTLRKAEADLDLLYEKHKSTLTRSNMYLSGVRSRKLRELAEILPRNLGHVIDSLREMIPLIEELDPLIKKEQERQE